MFGKGPQRGPLPVGRRGGGLEAEMRRVLRDDQRTEDRGGGNDNSHISKFFDQMEGEKEEEGKNKEGNEAEKEVKERKDKEVKVEKREDKDREEKGGNKKEGKGKEKEEKEEKEDKDGKEGEAELKARQEKKWQSSFEQIKSYRQRKKEEERRGKKWWTRFHMKLVRSPSPPILPLSPLSPSPKNSPPAISY